MSSAVVLRDRLLDGLLRGNKHDALDSARRLRALSDQPTTELRATARVLTEGDFEEMPTAFESPSLLGNVKFLQEVASVLTEGLEEDEPRFVLTQEEKRAYGRSLHRPTKPNYTGFTAAGR